MQEEQTVEPGVQDTRRAARQQRILDAAATLILRWGYPKTTVDDIARQAGVAKGTLYLHWKTREALFDALMDRERAALAEDVRQRIAADPDGASLHHMLRSSALALLQRPLLKAVILGDETIIGRLAVDGSRPMIAERAASFAAYLDVLRDQSLVRTDMSLQAQVFLISAVFGGFLIVAPLLPDEYRLPDEALADLLAETIQRTLASADAHGVAAEAAARYLDNVKAASLADSDNADQTERKR